MAHNLTFWSPPDWRRESTVSPVFVAVVVLSLFLVGTLAYASFVFTSKLSRQFELDQITAQNGEIAAQAGEVMEQQQKTKSWQDKVKLLRQESQLRVLWSRQLEALQELVPSNVTFSQMALRSEEMRITLPTRGPGGEKMEEIKTRYILTITGVAFGDNQQKSITDFAEKLPQHPEIGRYVQNRELRNISAGDAEDGTRFTLVCTYIPI